MGIAIEKRQACDIAFVGKRVHGRKCHSPQDSTNRFQFCQGWRQIEHWSAPVQIWQQNCIFDLIKHGEKVKYIIEQHKEPKLYWSWWTKNRINIKFLYSYVTCPFKSWTIMVLYNLLFFLAHLLYSRYVAINCNLFIYECYLNFGACYGTKWLPTI